MGKTQINFIHSDWCNIKNKCRTTVNKEYTENEPSEKFKISLLLAEHSPIRLFEVDWSWKDIPYWVSTEWSRHKFEKFISTQRSDRTGVDRSQKPQDSPVNMDCFANAQNLIDAWRKRLCLQASKECQELAKDFKFELRNSEPELSLCLVPHCVYRGGCSEMNPCGFYEKFKQVYQENNDLSNILTRYKCYEEFIKK